MPRVNKKNNRNKRTKKQTEKYNAENEIIIGVTTKPKEVRVERNKSTRTKVNNKKGTSLNKSKTQHKKKDNISKNKKKKDYISKEKDIKKSNRKKTIISLVILLFIAIGASTYMLTTPMFNITNIEVEGNEKSSEETYISLTKVELNSTNIFAITKNSIIKNIKENSYVEDVVVKRKLPNTLQVSVAERKVAYQAQYNEQYIYIDKQGYILEINSESANVVTIKGLSSTQENVILGKRLNNDDLLKLDTIVKIMNYCEYNTINDKIDIVDCTDTLNYTLYLEKDKKTVYLGDATSLSERILWLKTVLEREAGNKGEIFIKGNLNDTKVYFKPSTSKE